MDKCAVRKLIDLSVKLQGMKSLVHFTIILYNSNANWNGVEHRKKVFWLSAVAVKTTAY